MSQYRVTLSMDFARSDAPRIDQVAQPSRSVGVDFIVVGSHEAFPVAPNLHGSRIDFGSSGRPAVVTITRISHRLHVTP